MTAQPSKHIKVTAEVSEALHMRLKLFCVQEGISIKDWLSGLIERELPAPAAVALSDAARLAVWLIKKKNLSSKLACQKACEKHGGDASAIRSEIEGDLGANYVAEHDAQIIMAWKQRKDKPS